MWSAWVRVPLYALVFALGTLIVSAIEPFGLDDVVENQSRQILYRTFAPAYDRFNIDENQFTIEDPGENMPPYLRDATLPARERIATVYVNESVIHDMRNHSPGSGWDTWRPTYEGHALLILDIAELHSSQSEPTVENPDGMRAPPAIFFDFLFVEAGEDGSETRRQFDFFLDTIASLTRAASWPETGCETNLEKLVCIKEAGGVPLIFGRPIDVLGATAPPLMEKVAILAPVNYYGLGDGYPPRFPLDDTGEATPASLLYVSWCIDNPEGCPDLEPGNAETGVSRSSAIASAFKTRMNHPLSIVWGAAVPDDLVRSRLFLTGMRPAMIKTGLFGDKRVEPPSSSMPAAAESRMTGCRADVGVSAIPVLFFRQIFGGIAGSWIVQNCPYHLEIPYSAIPADLLSDPVKDRFFDGRAIIVGGQFRNAPDYRFSPVHGQISGMHGHAMALDNMMSFGKDYIHSPDRSDRARWFSIDAQGIADSLTLFFIILFGGLGQFWVNKRLITQARASALAKRPSHWFVYFVMLLTAVAITAISLYITTILLRIEPPNWIGHLSIAAGFYVYLLRDEFFDDIGRFMRRSKNVGASTLHGIKWWMSYFDLETVGFEGSRPPNELKDAKNEVVDTLYPRDIAAKHPTSGPDLSVQMPVAPPRR